jgi:predicted transcriptional regulator
MSFRMNEPDTEVRMRAKCRVIGKNLRENRLLRKLTTEEIAERLELSVPYVGLLERGDRCPSLIT